MLKLIDFYEVPGWLDADTSIPDSSTELFLHNLDLDWTLASVTAIDSQWGCRLQAALHRTQSAWFSLHLGFATERVYFDDHMHPVGTPLTQECLVERFTANLKLAKAACPVPLLVENLDYCPEGAYEHICEPEFISSILDNVDCGLLLDMGHLQVSASWLNLRPETYLDQLPLERVVEVHVSSPRPDRRSPGRLDDSHAEITPRDIELLLYLLSRAKPEAITLEYRKDAGKLVAQLELLREILE